MLFLFFLSSLFSIHLVLGLPNGLFPMGLHVKYFLGYQTSGILLTCPNHCSVLFSMNCNRGVTPRSSLIFTFLTLSLLETPLISLNTLISAACILDSVLVVNAHVSQPYVKTGLNIMVYIVALHCFGYPLLQ